MILWLLKRQISPLTLFLCFFIVIKQHPWDIKGFCHFSFLFSKRVIIAQFEICFLFGGVLIDGINWCLKGQKLSICKNSEVIKKSSYKEAKQFKRVMLTAISKYLDPHCERPQSSLISQRLHLLFSSLFLFILCHLEFSSAPIL